MRDLTSGSSFFWKPVEATNRSSLFRIVKVGSTPSDFRYSHIRHEMLRFDDATTNI